MLFGHGNEHLGDPKEYAEGISSTSLMSINEDFTLRRHSTIICSKFFAFFFVLDPHFHEKCVSRHGLCSILVTLLTCTILRCDRITYVDDHDVFMNRSHETSFFGIHS